jgi:hypothetical protein
MQELERRYRAMLAEARRILAAARQGREGTP